MCIHNNNEVLFIWKNNVGIYIYLKFIIYFFWTIYANMEKGFSAPSNLQIKYKFLRE